MVVIGSANSSNTVALERLARGAGCATVLRINTADELPRRADGSVDLHGVVGVTAGASAPEELVEQVIAALAPRDGVEEVHLTDEDEYFPPPRNLRDMLVAIDALGALGLGADPTVRVASDDRNRAASEVLADLT